MSGSRLSGRNAIVTGASRGLGRAIAIGMAAEGASVAVVARTEQVWDDRLMGTVGETVASITAAGGRAVAIAADLTLDADRARLLSEARSAFGPISILVNNAAFTAPGGPNRPAVPNLMRSAVAATEKTAWPSFMNTPLRAYRRHFEMVFAAYELMQAVVPDMEEAGYGSIINVTSGASRMPGEGPYLDRRIGSLAGYGGSKAALEHLTLSAAFEVGNRRIAINALSPTRAFLTPGVAFYDREFKNFDPEEDFVEAAIRLAVVDPDKVTGRVLGHADVLDGSFRPYVFNSVME